MAGVDERDHPEILGGRPQRFESLVHRREVGRGERVDQECAAPAGAHAREFPDAPVDVGRVDRGERREPILVTVNAISEPGVAGTDRLPGEVAICESAAVVGALEADGVGDVDPNSVHPRQPCIGVAGCVHGGALEAVPGDLLLTEDRGDTWRQELLHRRARVLRDTGQQVADLSAHGRLCHREPVRQPGGEGGIVVEPSRPGLEVGVDVDDHGSPV
jgi:hypothetical protein